jgi:hypothetical protein
LNTFGKIVLLLILNRAHVEVDRSANLDVLDRAFANFIAAIAQTLQMVRT